MKASFCFGFFTALAGSCLAQIQIDFSHKLNALTSLKAESQYDTTKGFVVFNKDTRLRLTNVQDPDFIVIDYSTNSEGEIEVVVSKDDVGGTNETRLSSFTIEKSNKNNFIPSDKLLLAYPYTGDLIISFPKLKNTVSVKSLKVYILDTKIADNLRLQKALQEFVLSKEITQFNSQLDNVERISDTTFNGLYELYHRQNSLLTELKVANFIHARNGMSNPMAFKKFQELTDNLKNASTDSVANDLLKEFKTKLKDDLEVKPNSNLSAIVSIGGGILNSITGGGFQGIFTGLKTLATNIIGNRSEIKYKDGKANDVSQLGKRKFIRKFNQGREELKVMSMMLNILEQDQFKINSRMERVKQIVNVIELQQVELLEFASSYFTCLNLKFDENEFIENSKLLLKERGNKLKNSISTYHTFIRSQKIPTTTNSEHNDALSKQAISTILSRSTRGTVLTNNYYQNSALVYGVFLDFATDLLSKKLIDEKHSTGLDMTIVNPINNEFEALRSSTVVEYCSLMKTMKASKAILKPSDFAEKEKIITSICNAK